MIHVTLPEHHKENWCYSKQLKVAKRCIYVSNLCGVQHRERIHTSSAVSKLWFLQSSSCSCRSRSGGATVSYVGGAIQQTHPWKFPPTFPVKVVAGRFSLGNSVQEITCWLASQCRCQCACCWHVNSISCCSVHLLFFVAYLIVNRELCARMWSALVFRETFFCDRRTTSYNLRISTCWLLKLA